MYVAHKYRQVVEQHQAEVVTQLWQLHANKFHQISTNNARSRDQRKTNLSLISKMNNETTNGKWRLICEGVIDSFRSHITGENTSIRCESSDCDAYVVIHFEDLLLMRRELRLGFVDARQDYMGARSESNCGWALLHCFHGVFYLEQTTCWAPCRHVCVVLIPEHLLFVESLFFFFVRSFSFPSRHGSSFLLSLWWNWTNGPYITWTGLYVMLGFSIGVTLWFQNIA